MKTLKKPRFKEEKEKKITQPCKAEQINQTDSTEI